MSPFGPVLKPFTVFEVWFVSRYTDTEHQSLEENLKGNINF